VPAAAPVFVPALPLLALLTWWTIDEGGYDATKWLPGTVLAVALLGLVVALRPRPSPPVPRPLRIALLGLGGLVAFSYLSIAWAGQPGAALQGSHRVLLYAAMTAIVALLPWTPGAVKGAVGALVGAAGIAAVVTLAKLHGASGTAGLFLDAQLTFPTGYHNATAALFTLAALPAVVLASRRDTPLPARPALLAVATLCESLALMTESRGWLFTLPIVLLAAIVIVPRRVRIVVFLLPVAGAVAAVSHRALAPYHAGATRDPFEAQRDIAQAAHHVAGPIVIAALAAGLAGLVLAAADRRIALGEARERLLRRGSLVAALVAVVAGVAVGLVAVHDPAGLPSRGWKSFKRETPQVERPGESRFSSLGSSRYDFWRVAFDEFKDHPVAGIGQDNFAQPYLAHRRANEEPRWTHSLELRALTHTGLVGAALMLAALGGLAWGLTAARRRGGAAREAAAIAALPAVVWIVHGSVDWLWEFPALSGWALGLAAAGATLSHAAATTTPATAAAPARRHGRGALVPIAAGLGALALAVAPALNWIAERDVAEAQREWPADPAGAFRRLDRAASLDPSALPKLVEGVIAVQVRDNARAMSAFRAARDREPHDWFAPFNIGLLASQAHQPRAAREAFLEARRRSPRDPVVREALRRAGTKRPMTFAQSVKLLRERSNRRFGPR
jgi:O-antigen ligase/polysaccharide polymerase Wzy-like membrane protein